MEIGVSQVLELTEGEEERIVYGTVKLSASPEEPGVLFLDKEDLEVSGAKKLFFSATYDTSTKNVSIFVKEDDWHIFTGVFSWTYPGTYFAFRLSDGVFTEMYLKL